MLLLELISPPPKTIGRVGHRRRSIGLNAHRQGDRRVALPRRQRIATVAGHSLGRDIAGPAGTRCGCGDQSDGNVVGDRNRAAGRRAAGVAHGQGVGTGLTLSEVARVALRDRQVGASGNRGWIGCRVVRWIGLAATENDGCVGHRRRGIDRDRHRERNRRIAGSRRQRIATVADRSLGRDIAGPAGTRCGCGDQSDGNVVDDRNRAAGRRAADVADRQV